MTTLLASTTVWNSLEIAKLLVGVLTPVVVGGMGFWINSRLKQIEHFRWANQKVIEQRLTVFKVLSNPLNDLLCYFTYIGQWKEMTPPDIVKLKRELDKIAYVNAPLFPEGFLKCHNAFMTLCYDTHQGWGIDAHLRTLTDRRKGAAGQEWNASWDEYFSLPERCPKHSEILEAYNDYVSYIAVALGVGLRSDQKLPTRLPGNIELKQGRSG